MRYSGSAEDGEGTLSGNPSGVEGVTSTPANKVAEAGGPGPTAGAEVGDCFRAPSGNWSVAVAPQNNLYLYVSTLMSFKGNRQAR